MVPCPLWIQFDQHFTRDTLLKEKWCIASCWLKTEDMKSIVSFIFSSSRLSTWAGFLSKSYKGIKQIYFQVYRICGEEMNRNYLDFTDLCKMNRRWKQPNKYTVPMTSWNTFKDYLCIFFNFYQTSIHVTEHFSEHKERPFEQLHFSSSLQNQENFCIQGLRENSLWLLVYKRRQPAL